jgi:hypothetical protein
MALDLLLPRILVLLGVGFLVANLRVLAQGLRFLRLRRTALVIWPGARPAFYAFALTLGVVLAVLVIVKLGVQGRRPLDAFGESMMMLYYGGALPLSLRFGRGLYEDGIWAETGFIRYTQIGGLSWREQPRLTLVLIDRDRQFARKLVVPEAHYAEARRVLRDKIAAHDIHFTGKSLDLGVHDERDDV